MPTLLSMFFWCENPKESFSGHHEKKTFKNLPSSLSTTKPKAMHGLYIITLLLYSYHILIASYVVH
jgi:hypothetical protein